MGRTLYSYNFTSLRDVNREFGSADVGEFALQRVLAALGRFTGSPEALLAHLVPGQCYLTGPLALWTLLGRLDEAPAEAHFVGNELGYAAVKAHLESAEGYDCVEEAVADTHTA